MEGETKSMNIVVLPWLALGHLLPFLELSRRFAEKGHRVYFVSTAKNIRRLPKLPPHLSERVIFIEFRLPSVDHLPADVEATIDLPTQSYSPLLHKAYDGLQEQFLDFIRSCTPPPEWVLFDYAAHWAPAAAAEVGSASAFLSLFNAATIAFLKGRISELKSLDDFITVPEWVRFPSTVCFRRHEIMRLSSPPVLPDGTRLHFDNHFGAVLSGGDAIMVRSSGDLEPEWLKLVENFFTKPVIPLGLFPPPVSYDDRDSPEPVKMLIQWLDEQNEGEVVYAAFGTEAKLSKEELEEILLGLEMSELPFVMVARAPASFLPEGFQRKAQGRGVVLNGWAPQMRILSHWATGGFLTHAGFNSTVEGLCTGVIMATLPLLFDQGLVARLLADKKIGMEVPRREDGSFSKDGIAKTLRFLMVDEEGEAYRIKAKENKKIYGDDKVHDKYITDFLNYLWDHRKF